MPVVLYENETGSNGTITLSESAENFTYIDVFYRHSDDTNQVNSTRVCSPNGKRISMNYFVNSSGTDKAVYIKTKNMLISGNTITNEDNRAHEIDIVDTSVYATVKANHLYVVKVVGYK